MLLCVNACQINFVSRKRQFLVHISNKKLLEKQVAQFHRSHRMQKPLTVNICRFAASTQKLHGKANPNLAWLKHKISGIYQNSFF